MTVHHFQMLGDILQEQCFTVELQWKESYKKGEFGTKKAVSLGNIYPKDHFEGWNLVLSSDKLFNTFLRQAKPVPRFIRAPEYFLRQTLTSWAYL